MENTLADSILHVCRVLNGQSIEYMIVGGTAVALHGYFRRSMSLAGVVTSKPDIDFWYNPTYPNYFKLLNALEELGQDVTGFRNEQIPNPKTSFFKYEFSEFTLDLLPELKAPLRFGVSYRTKEVVTINGVDIPFINYEDLILDKRTDPRPKDLTDIEQLEVVRKTKG